MSTIAILFEGNKDKFTSKTLWVKSRLHGVWKERHFNGMNIIKIVHWCLNSNLAIF